MPRGHEVYLDDILEASRRISSYTKGMTQKDFEKSPMAIDAVIRNLEVIGEAAGKLPDEVKATSPRIEWRKIVALRNVLAHEYFGVNTPIVWDIITTKLKPLEAACRELARSGRAARS